MLLQSIDKNKPIHMVGIGGVSMSGIAEILLNMGYLVQGSNITLSEVTNRLEKNGIKVYEGHHAENVMNCGLVVYSAAIKQDNPELVKARELNIPTVERATFLGELTKLYAETIAISGTHGKTTTTSMLSLIFMEAQKDPTIQVGADLSQLGGVNYRVGASPYFIVEACEYVESFLQFAPKTAVILNIEEDHLDYYKDLNHIKSAFHQFAKLVPNDGYVVYNCDDANCNEVMQDISNPKITFGIENPNAMWKAKDILLKENGHYSFTATNGEISIPVTLKVFGKHHIYNALASIAVSIAYGIDPELIASALGNFTGAHRRFEYIGSYQDATIYDDYAHHPTEIKATIQAANSLAHHQLWVIFQPHTYSRTITLFDEFAHAFSEADHVIIADIYAAREIDTGEVSAKKLSDAIHQVSGNSLYVGNFENIVTYLQEHVSKNDLILTVGAGNVYEIGESLIK